eukprot:scaffold25626_cov137-Cylindrotheca_fusiformis.AAC.8
MHPCVLFSAYPEEDIAKFPEAHPGHGTSTGGIRSGPHQANNSFISGQDIGYGAVREKGFRPSLFCLSTVWLQPYGSVSKGLAAFSNSPFLDSSKSKPVEAGGSTPMNTNLSLGHLNALA